MPLPSCPEEEPLDGSQTPSTRSEIDRLFRPYAPGLAREQARDGLILQVEKCTTWSEVWLLLNEAIRLGCVELAIEKCFTIAESLAISPEGRKEACREMEAVLSLLVEHPGASWVQGEWIIRARRLRDQYLREGANLSRND